MNFDLIKSVVELVQKFTEQNEDKILYNNDLQGFIQWINASFEDDPYSQDPLWIGKELGRSSDSVINTLFVRIGRYAKMYSRSIGKSVFSSQDDFIYMISLKVMGAYDKNGTDKT